MIRDRRRWNAADSRDLVAVATLGISLVLVLTGHAVLDANTSPVALSIIGVLAATLGVNRWSGQGLTERRSSESRTIERRIDEP